MLVIVVVAAGIGAAAVALLRRPGRSESDKSGNDPQPRESPANTVPGQPPPAVTPPTSAPVTPPEPVTPPVIKPDEELEFTIETADSAEKSADVHAPAPTTTAPTVQAIQPAEAFARLFELALGKARAPASLNPGHADIVAAVTASIEDAATQDRYVPRRPNMLPKVLSASNDDSFSRRELAALIARDPSLVGNLLKIANSSYYRVTPEPVESVERAVVLLGTDGIRSLVTAALMQPIFRIGGADFPRFPDIAWEHAFRSASAGVAHNFLVEKSDPFAAELLSLVMGLAAIVIFRITLDHYAKSQRLRPDAGVVSSLLDKHAAAVARRIGATWELSATTLAGLDGQTADNTSYPTALGRSLYFGRVTGALAVLRLNRIIDDATGKASIPAANVPEDQLARVWSRLTHEADKR